MIAAPTITPEQLKRLQVLSGQYQRRSLDMGDSREARIAWASQRIHRQIASFSDLTVDEGIRLIDGLQAALGTKVPSKTPRRRQTRRDAEKSGTEGRRDQIHAETTLAGPRDLRRIQDDVTRLGWDEARLKAFLASPKSPTKGSTTIRTLGDANKVHWALKGMATQAKGARPIAS